MGREPLWKIALGVAIGGMAIGILLGAIVLSNSWYADRRGARGRPSGMSG
jgi:hypothetical protein